MKKNIIIIATIAMILVGCSDNSLRSDIQDDQTKIGFSTITNLQTRAENSSASINGNLENYNTTFKVWGYKVVAGTETAVLGAVVGSSNTTYPGQLVSHVEATTNPAVAEHWEYTPIRFWDKSATLYKFYAVSPSREDWVWDNANRKVSISNFAISGYNSVTGTPATAVVTNKVLTQNLTTEDLMISTDITNYKNYTNTPVNLSFNHILSRLNIGVRKATTLDNFTVYLKSIKVFNMKSNGSFNESLASGTDLSGGTIARWATAPTTPTTFTSGVGYDALSDLLEITSTETTPASCYQYVYEGLVIPQSVAYSKSVLVNEDITDVSSYLYINGSNAVSEGGNGDSDPYIVIEYEIGKTENSVYTKHDSYKYYYNLADVFNGDATTAVNFCEGWQNTLKITIAPTAIDFDADVFEWAEKYPSQNYDAQ